MSRSEVTAASRSEAQIVAKLLQRAREPHLASSLVAAQLAGDLAVRPFLDDPHEDEPALHVRKPADGLFERVGSLVDHVFALGHELVSDLGRTFATAQLVDQAPLGNGVEP